jgi:hypothetical protein
MYMYFRSGIFSFKFDVYISWSSFLMTSLVGGGGLDTRLSFLISAQQKFLNCVLHLHLLGFFGLLTIPLVPLLLLFMPNVSLLHAIYDGLLLFIHSFSCSACTHGPPPIQCILDIYVDLDNVISL